MAELVFRVERSSDGAGPYTTGCTGDLDGTGPDRPDCYCSWRCPAPWSDFDDQPWENTDYSFGFTSRAQFQAWFTVEACKVLASRGFVLAIYQMKDAARVIHGNKQCVFQKAHAVLLEIEQLTEE